MDMDVLVIDVIQALLAEGHEVRFYRKIEPLHRARINKWLSGELDPPDEDLSDEELAEVLQVIVESELMSDRRFGFVAHAISRLRGE